MATSWFPTREERLRHIAASLARAYDVRGEMKPTSDGEQKTPGETQKDERPKTSSDRPPIV